MVVVQGSCLDIKFIILRAPLIKYIATYTSHNILKAYCVIYKSRYPI